MPALVLQTFRWPRKRFLFIRGFIVIMAGFLVHLSLGTVYTFGNIVPYVVSYIRKRAHPADLSAETGTWIFALNLFGAGVSIVFGGWLERKIGPRFSTLAGGWLMSAGVLLSYFTIKVSFWLLVLTYGLTFGLGMGIAYVGPLSCAMRWMPRWKGVAGGFVLSGFGLGALIFDQVQSHYINPHNLKPTDGYFTDPDLLDRVPYVFLILGGTYAVMQFIGSMLIVNPPHNLHVPLPLQQLHSSQGPLSSLEMHQEVGTKVNTNCLRDGSALSHCEPEGTSVPAEEQLMDLEHAEAEEHESMLNSSEHKDNCSLIKAATNPPVHFSETLSLSFVPPTDQEVTSIHPSSSIRTTSNESTSPSSSPSQSPAPLMEVTSVHPLRMLRTLSFYHLWSMMLLTGFSVSFIATLFKVFGLTFIDDDQFLATVGSMSAVLNSAGRIVWGLVADKFSYKFAFVLRSGIMTVFLLTFYATSAVGKPMFFIWVCIIFFCVGGVFSIYPAAIAHQFGPKYMSINFGLLFTSLVCSGVVAALLFTTLEDILDWDGLIFLISGLSLIDFLLAILLVWLDDF